MLKFDQTVAVPKVDIVSKQSFRIPEGDEVSHTVYVPNINQ